MVTEIGPALAFCSLLLFCDFSSRGCFSLSSSCVKPNQCRGVIWAGSWELVIISWAIWARSNQKISFDLPWPILLLFPPLFQEGRKEDIFYLVEVSQSTQKIKYHFKRSLLWKLALRLPGAPHNPPLFKGLTVLHFTPLVCTSSFCLDGIGCPRVQIWLLPGSEQSRMLKPVD